MSMTRQEVFQALADGRAKELRWRMIAYRDEFLSELQESKFNGADWSLVEPVTHYCDSCGRILCGAHTAGFAKGEGWVHDWNKPRAPVTCPACLALRPKAPEMVPLGPEDVPPGSVLRDPAYPVYWELVVNVGVEGCKTDSEEWGWAELRDDRWEISRDFGKTWTRCQKPKEAK